MDRRRDHVLNCLVLMLLGCTIEAWSLEHAVVPAQDSVRFVAVAQAIERAGALAVWRSDSGPPLFPTLIAWTHTALRQLGHDDSDSWAKSSQLAATMALLATIVPLYFLLARWFSARVALVGGIFFCTLGEFARLGADALSDSTHLFFFTAALGSLAIAVDRRRTSARPYDVTAWSLAAGVWIALAVLTHRQAWLAVVAMLAAFVFPLIISRRRPGWAVPRLGGLVAGMVLVLMPYTLLQGVSRPTHVLARLSMPYDPDPWAMLNVRKGGFDGMGLSLARETGSVVTKKVSSKSLPGQRLRAGGRIKEGEAGNHRGFVDAGATNRRTPAPDRNRNWVLKIPSKIPSKETSTTSRRRGYRAAMAEFGREISTATGYWIGLLALVGLWVGRSSANHSSGSPGVAPIRDGWASPRGLAAMVAVVWTGGTIYHAATAGYLSTRHVLPLALMSLGWAACGAFALGDWLAIKVGSAGFARRGASVTAGWVVVAAAAGACLPRTLAPLHRSRAAHRMAGRWLAQPGREPGRVLDSRGWSAFYSGRLTYRMLAASAAVSDPQLAYVVMEQRELHFNTRRARTWRRLLASCGPPVAKFRRPGRSGLEDVVIFRWRPDRVAGLPPPAG